MDYRRIIIPNRREGWLYGVKSVVVEWKCPECGQDMGEPTLKQFCEDGEFYSVHVWNNACGHVAKYKDLKVQREVG